jgi:isohexenylglutaconyl-CoA hydratase
MSTNAKSAALEVNCRAGIWFARLNRPERRNALSEELVQALLTLCARVDEDTQSRAVVLWGAGDNFCAGADTSRLTDMLDAPPAEQDDALARHNRAFGSVLTRLRALLVPSIAVVRGSAIGGGCGLAATCNLVLATEEATFAMPEVTLGLAPAQIAPFIVERIGKAKARWYLICGEPMTAHRAQEIGLADVIVQPTELQGAVATALRSVLKTEPEAVRVTRRLIGALDAQELAAVLDYSAAEFARLVRRGEVRAGLAALRARRAPAWVVDVPELPEFS